MYHPDVNPKDKRAKDKFIALTEAYKILLKVASAQTELTYNSTPISTTKFATINTTSFEMKSILNIFVNLAFLTSSHSVVHWFRTKPDYCITYRVGFQVAL